MLDSFNGDLLLNIKDYSPSGASTVFSEHVTPISETEISRNMAVASKRKRQDLQAKVMIRNRGKDISNVGIGAVVTISLNKRDVSPPTAGVRAVVFNTKEETGGIQVCSEGGIRCQNGKLFWIPCDRYRVTSSADQSAVLTDGLTTIRNEILQHTFNVATKKKISLNQAQKQFTGRSPRKKSVCHCRGGRCGNRCGCTRRRNNGNSTRICSSACSCSGNCQNTC